MKPNHVRVAQRYLEKTANVGFWGEILKLFVPRRDGWRLGGADDYSVNASKSDHILVLSVEYPIIHMEIITNEKDPYGGWVTENHSIKIKSMPQISKEVREFAKEYVP